MHLVLLLCGLIRAESSGELADTNAAVHLRAAFAAMYVPTDVDSHVWQLKPDAWPQSLKQLVPQYLDDDALLTPPSGSGTRSPDGNGVFGYWGDEIGANPLSQTPHELNLFSLSDPTRESRVQWYIKGYADGHVEWAPYYRKPVSPGTRRVVAALMRRARTVAVALHGYARDHGQDFTVRLSPWSVMKDYLSVGRASPSVALHPQVARVCVGNTEAVDWHLKRAAAAPTCDFGTGREQCPTGFPEHVWRTARLRVVGVPEYICRMQQLRVNAICYGKRLESAGDPAAAIHVYNHLFRAARRLVHEDVFDAWLAGLFAEMHAVHALAACAVRNDGVAEVAHAVLASLRTLRDAEPKRELSRLCLASFRADALLWQALREGTDVGPLTAERRRDIERLFSDPRDLRESAACVKRKASLMALPPSEAFPRLQKQRRRHLCFGACRHVSLTYERFIEADAELGASLVLVAAMLHKAESGAHPEVTRDLHPLFPEGFPRNPWSDRDYSYTLGRDGPTVTYVSPTQHFRRIPIFGVAGIRRREVEFTRLGLSDKIKGPNKIGLT